MLHTLKVVIDIPYTFGIVSSFKLEGILPEKLLSCSSLFYIRTIMRIKFFCTYNVIRDFSWPNSLGRLWLKRLLFTELYIIYNIISKVFPHFDELTIL